MKRTDSAIGLNRGFRGTALLPDVTPCGLNQSEGGPEDEPLFVRSSSSIEIN